MSSTRDGSRPHRLQAGAKRNVDVEKIVEAVVRNRERSMDDEKVVAATVRSDMPNCSRPHSECLPDKHLNEMSAYYASYKMVGFVFIP